MSGLTGLIDALLAVKASPRLDVLAIKGETQIGPPGAVAQVLKVQNDVRLPSKAALDRVLPGGSPSLPPAAAAAAHPSEAELSVAARVISAVLADLESDAGPVRGAAPAWPSRQAPTAPALAGALAQTLAHSGLFYESHLLEFATGNRPLAQLMQEPQARWATPLAAQRAAEPVGSVAVTAALAGAASEEATAAVAVAADPKPADPAASARTAQPAVGAAVRVNANLPMGAAVDPAQDSDGAPATIEATRLQAAYGRSAPAGPTPAPGTIAASDASTADPVEGAAHHAAALAAKAPVPVAEVIHPQAVNLVHQQLDLLATAVFRWNGEAWPGVAMNWSVEKEPADASPDGTTDDKPQRWSTTVAMSLPRLGNVELRLSLAGPGVHARLTATEADTVTALRAEGRTLTQRMEAAGLRLQDLQVAPMTGTGAPS